MPTLAELYNSNVKNEIEKLREIDRKMNASISSMFSNPPPAVVEMLKSVSVAKTINIPAIVADVFPNQDNTPDKPYPANNPVALIYSNVDNYGVAYKPLFPAGSNQTMGGSKIDAASSFAISSSLNRQDNSPSKAYSDKPQNSPVFSIYNKTFNGNIAPKIHFTPNNYFNTAFVNRENSYNIDEGIRGESVEFVGPGRNQFGTNINSQFGWGFPNGLGFFDVKAWFDLTRLQVKAMIDKFQGGSGKTVGAVADLAIPFLLQSMNPTWGEGQIWNPISLVGLPPPFDGLMPTNIDVLAVGKGKGHSALVGELSQGKRDDILRTYKSDSGSPGPDGGGNVIHGAGDAPYYVDARFPFIHIKVRPFAESANWPPKVTIERYNDALNPNNSEAKYPKYQPVSQDDVMSKGVLGEDFYKKLYKKPSDINVGSSTIDKPKSPDKKSWQLDYDNWGETEIIASDKVGSMLKDNELYLPILLTDLRTNRTTIIKPYIKRISEEFSPVWTPSDYFGRVDSIYTYKNTKRTMNLDLMFAAHSPEDSIKLRNKVKFMENLVFPMYDTSGLSFVSAPVIRIKVGDLISADNENAKKENENAEKITLYNENHLKVPDNLHLGCPAIITQFSYDFSEVYPWNIEKGKIRELILEQAPIVFGISLQLVLFHDIPRGIPASGDDEGKLLPTI